VLRRTPGDTSSLFDRAAFAKWRRDRVASPVDGRSWDTEVVWGVRLDPARIRIQNVPLPSSGHRFGDVVLHDGDPSGTRVLDGQEVPVFDEILLRERSPVPTCGVAVTAPADVEAVLTSWASRDVGRSHGEIAVELDRSTALRRGVSRRRRGPRRRRGWRRRGWGPGRSRRSRGRWGW